MAKETCETCRFWSSTGDDRRPCRRYPPTVTSTYDGLNVKEHEVRPLTFAGSWCGEWQSIPNPVAPFEWGVEKPR